MSEENVDIQQMDLDELKQRLEGGLYALFSSEEEYADLFKVSAALGLKDFVQNSLGDKDREAFLAMFADGEQAISEFVQYASKKGLLEFADDDEDDE